MFGLLFYIIVLLLTEKSKDRPRRAGKGFQMAAKYHKHTHLHDMVPSLLFPLKKDHVQHIIMFYILCSFHERLLCVVAALPGPWGDTVCCMKCWEGWEFASISSHFSPKREIKICFGQILLRSPLWRASLFICGGEQVFHLPQIRGWFLGPFMASCASSQGWYLCCLAIRHLPRLTPSLPPSLPD